MGQTKASRRGKQEAGEEPIVPSVYRDMLREAAHDAALFPDRPAAKKRRIGGQIAGPEQSRSDDYATSEPRSKGLDLDRSSPLTSNAQVIYQESDESDESDADFEDVDLGATSETSPTQAPKENLDLVLNDDSTSKARAGARRKAVTNAQRQVCILGHKMHILCLIWHASLRNHWANGARIQSLLKPLLPKSVRAALRGEPSWSQYRKSRSLNEGLIKASEIFAQHFSIEGSGLQRCAWLDSSDQTDKSEAMLSDDLPILKADFEAAARNRTGSRDVGAQLFCAMLRAVGLEVRLVISLQVLPLSPTARNTTPNRREYAYVVREGESSDQKTEQGTAATAADGLDAISESLSRVRRSALLGKKAPGRIVSPSKPVDQIKLPVLPPVRESRYPVFWAEVFDAASQKWLPVDPLVTKSVGKASKFEPPASDAANSMSYVIAFEEDGFAYDVTRRYTKAYHAKTHRTRIESTPNGRRWWQRALRLYKRPYKLDLEQVEQAELAAREAAEPMPRNIADMKNHPYFALVRHLRRNEVIRPQHEVGRIAAGKSTDGIAVLEPVFRRRDVHLVRTADAWYRLGRQVKSEEIPAKWTKPRRRRDDMPDPDAQSMETNPSVPMFVVAQTENYRPPPVQYGRVPRNEYGNLDVYVASMVPAGGVHILHPDASRAARLLGLDYADAVTGFEFRGRTGTAVVRGAVVAAEYHEAVTSVIEGFMDIRRDDYFAKRSHAALRMWSRMLNGLRIRERIQNYQIEGEDRNDNNDEMSDAPPSPGLTAAPTMEPSTDEQEAGEALAGEQIVSIWGPHLDSLHEPEAEDTRGDDARASSAASLFGEDPNDDEMNGGGFLLEDHDSDTNQLMEKFEASTGPAEDHEIVMNDSTEGDVAPKIEVEVGEQIDADAAALPKTADAEANGHPAPRDVPEAKEADMQAPPDMNGKHQIQKLSPVQSEHGSLMSHDPEDEDAEPDWLGED